MNGMRLASTLLALALTLNFSGPNLHSQKARAVTHVTVPMSVEGNTPIVTLTFKRLDGSLRTARFVFDSGGGGIIFDQGLAKNLGLKPYGAFISEDGQQYRAVQAPQVFVGGMPINVRTTKAFVHQGATSFTNRVAVEGLLPGKALEHYQVVLDYPRQLFSVGEAGSLSHRGKQLACPYVASSGHPRVEVGIDGTTYGFLLDTGTNITLIRDDMLQKWSREHRDWPSSIGATGPANDGGTSDGDVFLLRIPALQLGAFRLTQVAAASRPDKTYSPTSYETPAPIIGALGGNVLSRFRVEIDYPDQLLFLEQSGGRKADDFDTVGLVLGTNSQDQLVVLAVSPTASAVTRRNILPGDVILGISGSGNVPHTLMKATQALSGVVGESKRLPLLRNGKPMRVTVVVARTL